MFSASRFYSYNGELDEELEIVVLEPDAVKVASPVLRGEWFRNELFLPATKTVLPGFLGVLRGNLGV